jgi:hypothetical protein
LTEKTDARIAKHLRISGKVLGVGLPVRLPGCRLIYGDSTGARFDWAYCRSVGELHQVEIDPGSILRLCDVAKHVAVVCHTKQSGKTEENRFHHKKKTLDNALHSKLVSSSMVGNFYVAVLANVKSEWSFVTVEDLSSATLELVPKIPSNVSSVVAMHRSGTVPAAMLAAVLHVPCHVYSNANGLIEMGGGGRTATMKEQGQLRLVIDDTVSSGKSIQKVKGWLAKHDKHNRYLYAAIFASPHGATELDMFARTLRTPHLLEWNFLNSCHSKNIAVDLDGVLCYDPPEFDETTEAGRAEYLEWIRNATVRYPARWGPLSAIVSYRCEYTREATEEWLRKSGIGFDALHLFPGEPQERTFKANQWKGRFYKSSPHRLFVESSASQARGIREYSGKPVLDLENKQMLGVL